MADGSGTAARNGDAKQPAAIAADPLSRSRLERLVAIIESLPFPRDQA
jgi:hypothetical protein